MSTDIQKKVTGPEPSSDKAEVSVSAPSSTPPAFIPSNDRRGGPRGQRGRRSSSGPGGGRRGGQREGRTRSEFDQKILDIRRVARVAAGGRRFNFSVVVIIGDRKGQVGVGTGKAGDTALAIDKAVRNAKKNMLRLHLTKTNSIPYEIKAKYSSARVMMLPAPGRGLVAGSALRGVLELAGVKDVTAKIISPSKNKLNIARAAVQGLSPFASSGNRH